MPAEDVLSTPITDCGFDAAIVQCLTTEARSPRPIPALRTLGDCVARQDWRPKAQHGIRHMAFHSVKRLLAGHGVDL